jgi:hypothetical protein
VPGAYLLLAIDDGRQLAYRDPDAIHPYLPAGLPITVPFDAQVVVNVFARRK